MSDNNKNSNDEQQAESKQRNGSFDATRMTCDALCSLSASGASSLAGCCGPPGSAQSSISGGGAGDENNSATATARRRKSGSNKGQHASSSSQTCPKQLQLPMFLSKTYHMIDRCDSGVAGWGDSGDSFVVKNVEKFASNVLPLYFKHSNFSSFARQLNFYGFRKLRSDPILTSDVDPSTACHVRFFHEHFQKDKPELLHQIKRATKTDQQSRDDVDSLKAEVSKLREQLTQVTAEYDRKLAELSYDCNRRISAMSAEQDKLALVVQQSLGVAAAATATAAGAAAAPRTTTSAGTAVLAAGASHDLLHSLSQAAMSLQRHFPAAATAATTNVGPPLAPPAALAAPASTVGTKRAATDDDALPSENGKKHPKTTRK